jgi:predicted SpoU family rRNA methylase
LCGAPADLEHLQKPTYIVIRTNSIETCSYTKRALTAQAIGAKGIVIASSKADYAKGSVIESDDGNGKKVHITCLHITSKSFEQLQRLNKIEIIAKFPVPQ